MFEDPEPQQGDHFGSTFDQVGGAILIGSPEVQGRGAAFLFDAATGQLLQSFRRPPSSSTFGGFALRVAALGSKVVAADWGARRLRSRPTRCSVKAARATTVACAHHRAPATSAHAAGQRRRAAPARPAVARPPIPSSAAASRRSRTGRSVTRVAARPAGGFLGVGRLPRGRRRRPRRGRRCELDYN